MAIALVQSNTASASGLSLAVAYTSNNIAGNLLAVAVRCGSGTTTISITDSVGNTWVGIPENPQTVGSNHRDAIFYVLSALAGANTVTVHSSIAATIRPAIFEVGGFDGAVTLDQHASQQGNSTTPTSPTVVTTIAHAWAIGLVSALGVSTLNSWTAPFGAETAIDGFAFCGDTVFVATQSVATAATLGAATNWGALIASFGGGAVVGGYTTGARPDSATVSQGDFVRYVNSANYEYDARVTGAGPFALDAAIDLTLLTWPGGVPTITALTAVPSVRTVGAPPYWTA